MFYFFGQRFQAGYSSKQTKVGRQCYWAVSDVMDSLFAFFSAVRANFGWLQLHPKIRRHPFLDLEYRAKVWSHPPQCLSLLAKVVLSQLRPVSPARRFAAEKARIKRRSEWPAKTDV